MFGLGKTGTSIYLYVKNFCKNIIAYDDNHDLLKKFLISYSECGSGIDNIQSVDFILLSPGISLHHPLLQSIERSKILSDIDIAYIDGQDKRYIGITGTNGKSTTTSLLAHILSEQSFVPVGNIGIPILTHLPEKKNYVVELSSFQLDLVKHYRSDIAIILNITSDHLDRYGDINKYAESKMKILDNAKVGIVCINDLYTKRIYDMYKGKLPVLPIYLDGTENQVFNSFEGLFRDRDFIKIAKEVNFSDFNIKKYCVIPPNQYLLGQHNLQNIMAAMIASIVFGVDIAHIYHKISTFIGLPHRMQYVCSINKVSFFNDSKATNPDSASKSIAILNEIFLLVGGIAKSMDIIPILPYIHKIKRVFVFGRDSLLFYKLFSEHCKYVSIHSCMLLALDEAFTEATIADSYCNILLAPCASSLDQFKNYEDRGDIFIKRVKEISGYQYEN